MRSVGLHLVLAIAGLLLAYQTWTRGDEQEAPPGEVTVVPCQPEQLVSFTMKSKSRDTIVEPRTLDDEKVYWISVQSFSRKPKPRPKEPAPEHGEKTESAEGERTASEKTEHGETNGEHTAGEKPASAEDEKTEHGEPEAPENEEQITTRSFLGNRDFDEYMKWIAPLRAARSLGAVSAKQLESFGLDEIETTLEIACGGQKRSVQLGAWTYGHSDRYRYARLAGEKRVFLVPGAMVNDLLSAGYKFRRKELHGFGLGEVDEARVRARDTERTLLHRNRRVPDSAMWVDASAPDRRNRLFDNWFRQVARLEAYRNLEVDEQPGSDLEQQSGEVEQLLTIEYLQAGKPLGKMELVRITADKPYYFARTEHTHTWVELARNRLAEQVTRDAAMVLGTEEAPEQPAGRP